MSIELSTSLSFHPLSFLEEDDEVVIGRSAIDSYGVCQQDGAALLRELRAGRSPAHAVTWYEATYGQSVDMPEFLETLHELRFLCTDADEVQHSAEEEADAQRPVRWQRLGRALFSSAACCSPAPWALASAIRASHRSGTSPRASLIDPDAAHLMPPRRLRGIPVLELDPAFLDAAC